MAARRRAELGASEFVDYGGCKSRVRCGRERQKALFRRIPDVEATHKLSQLCRVDAAAAGELFQQGVGVGDARATGSDLGANDRLNRLREHLPIRLEVSTKRVLREEDLTKATLQIVQGEQRVPEGDPNIALRCRVGEIAL